MSPAPHADRDHSEARSIVGMIDRTTGRPATIYTPPEALQRDPNRWPTPREFVDEWEQYSHDHRLAMAERILNDAQTASRCFVMNHEVEIGWLRTRAEAAEAERDQAAGRLSALLCDLTGGRLSKPTYDVRTMVQEIEEHLTRELEIDAAAERDRARSLAATLEARLVEAEALHVPCSEHPTCSDDDHFCHECGQSSPCTTVRFIHKGDA